MKYCFDKLEFRGGKILCEGWAVPEVPGGNLKVTFLKADRQPAEASVSITERPDVGRIHFGDEAMSHYGFAASLPYSGDAEMSAVFQTDGASPEELTVPFSPKALFSAWKKEHSFPAVFRRFLKSEDKKNFRKIESYSEYSERDREYAIWKLEHEPDQKELRAQRSSSFPGQPLVSIAVPVYRPALRHLKEMAASVLAQTYGSWEMCIAAAPELSPEAAAFLKQLAAKHRNIRVSFLQENFGIAGNTNRALETATGEYTAFLDQDDLLRADALYEYVRAARLNSADVVYCDEDKLDDETGIFFDAHFKPDYNPDLLCCNNYICHMLFVRSELLEKVGDLNPELSGAQDHDLLLRLSEVTDRFIHIPKILYSWRCHRDSTAMNPESKAYAYAAGKTAIDEHYMRCRIPATSEPMQLPGWYRTEFSLKEKPLISILIPNRDHPEDLLRCIRSIREKSSYRNLEFVVIENGSTDPETFEAYRTLSAEDSCVRVISWSSPFNYSAINNFAAREARGELLLLLNNDTEIISPDAIESMAGYCLREDVGAVGARLFYDDDTIQHAGVLVGVSDGADHVFLHCKKEDPGYMGRAIVSQDLSAVTAACMMVRKERYFEAGGMDEGFSVAYNDVDFCLKLQELGYRVVYDAFAEWYHYESKTRGYEETAEQKERFRKEQALLRERWPVRMLQDPYYNRNLSLKHGYYNR